MSWIHVSNSGAQATSGSQTSLSATFPGAIAAGDLIVVSVAFYGPYAPTVQDTTHTTLYTYRGPTPGATQQIGTWYYIAIKGASSFEVTVTGNGAAYLAMTIDAYSLTSGDVIGIDSSGYASGTSATPTLSPALPVTTTDLVYVACLINGTSGTVSAGTGFAIRYSEPIIGGHSYGIAVEDYANESSDITPSFSFADSTNWGLNAIAFKAISQSVTIVGPSQGIYNAQQEFSLSLAGPAGAGGIVVTLASSNGSDTFQATSGGSNITSITVPASTLSANFYFTTSSTGTRNISISAGSVSCPNSPYAYDALAAATSYTVTGATGGHQLVPVTWRINLIGGDFVGTITATPGGGTSQCQIVYPIVTTFTGNGTLSQNFTFTPQNQDLVTFTFTNSGGLTNPSPETYTSTIMYYEDTFVGHSGTSIAAHTSNLLPGVAGSGYTVTGGTIELDGNGMVFQSSAGPTYAITQAVVPAFGKGVSFQVLFEVYPITSIAGTQAGVILMTGHNSVYILYEGNKFGITTGGIYNVNISSHVPSVGQTWYMMVNFVASGDGVIITTYYSPDNVNWNQMLGGPPPWTLGQVGTTISVGPYFNSATIGTPTTGTHIGNIVVQDIAPASPNCQIATSSPVGTAGAYVGTSGRNIIFFFEQLSNRGVVVPTAMNYSPTIYRNGISIGLAVEPWITGYHACAILQLMPGIQIATTDIVAITAPASWMSCGAAYASNAVSSPLTIANYTGKSCFGTAELTKTLKPGFNFSDLGTIPETLYNIPRNWRYRLGMPGYPTNMGSTTITPWFISYAPCANGIDSTNYPGIAGYWAIGFDDNYIANSGVATQLSIVSTPGYPGATVTQITGNNNPGVYTSGVGYLDQYYLFYVEQTPGSTTANIPLALQWVNSARTPCIRNLWIVAPGDFTVPEPGDTTWTFDRSNPYALSNEFLGRLANGAGSMRWIDATLGFANNCNMTQPWEETPLDAFTWDPSSNPTISIAYSEARPFSPSGSHVYQEFVASQLGSTWTCSSGLSASITSTTATTITINSAYTDPIFSGVLIEIDSEQMYVQSLPGAITSSGSTLTGPNTLDVIRGAFGTTATTHAEGARVTILSKRWALSSLSNLSGGPAHIVEFVTTTPHGLQGPVLFPLGGNFPTFTFTDGTTEQYSNVTTSQVVTGPWVTGPNTFVTVESVSVSTTQVTLEATQSLSSSTPSSWTPSLGNGFPMEFIAMATGSFPGTNLQVNIPLSATSAYIYDVAVKIRNNFPAGRRVYLELADEPWNYFFSEYYFCGLLSSLAGYGNYYYYVVMRTQEIRTIFQNAFGSRAGEIYTIINNQFGYAGVPWVSYTGTPTSSDIDNMDPLQLAAYLGVHVDARAVAPYTNLDDSSVTITAWNNATTIQQLIDLVIHDLYYCNNVFPYGGWNAYIAAGQADIAAYNAATGGNCFLYAYEGGWGGPPAGINNSTTLSHDIVYDPNWLIIEQDMFALWQNAGFVNVNIYSYDIYYYGSANWGVYHGPGQLPGRGDGSDGKANNRLCLATPGFEYSKAATTNQDQFCVSVRGQAFLEWMQPAQGKKRMLFVPYRFVNR